MPINKATQLKLDKQIQERTYAKRMRDMSTPKGKLYDVMQGETLVKSCVPIEQCTKYIGCRIVPVSIHEQFAHSA